MPDIDLQDLNRRVQEAVAHQRARQGTARETSTQLRLPRAPRTLPPIADKRSYSLDELLRYHDDDFVRTAFRAVLGREPDGEFPLWVQKLRTGRRSKIEILGRMRFSKMGAARGVQIDGLLPRYVAHKALRLPLVGRAAATAVQAARLTKWLLRFEQLQGHVERELDRIRAFLNELSDSIEQGGSDVMRQQIERVFLLANKRLHAVEQALARLERLEQDTGASAQAAAQLEQRVKDLSRQVEHLTEAQSHLQWLARDAASPPAAAPASGEPAPTPVLDPLYAALEDRFRGTREEIIQRAEGYLPSVRAVSAGSQDRPILDVGCGRGEWLEVLARHELAGAGVDSNRAMVDRCRERSLSATHADAIQHLRGLPAASLGAVTALHVVEHLPFPVLIELIDQSLRVLKPGGVAIFETPNPENLAVGSCHFYLDPTHRNPLPPPLLQFLAQARGFSRTEVRGLTEHRPAEHPSSAAARGTADELLSRPYDYALFAYKD